MQNAITYSELNSKLPYESIELKYLSYTYKNYKCNIIILTGNYYWFSRMHCKMSLLLVFTLDIIINNNYMAQ